MRASELSYTFELRQEIKVLENKLFGDEQEIYDHETRQQMLDELITYRRYLSVMEQIESEIESSMEY